MSLVVILKFFHYLGLFIAGGGGVAGGVIQAAHAKAETPPAPPVQVAMRSLAWLALVALVVIWITGIGLVHLVYGGFNLGWAFNMKLLGATVLLGASIMINLHLAKSAKSGTPPNAALMNRAAMAARGALVLVLAGIAITTSS